MVYRSVSIRYALDLYPRTSPRDGARIRRFTHLQAADWRDEANGTGSGRFVIRGTTLDAEAIDPKGLQYVRVVEIATGYAEKVVGGFWAEPGKYEALTKAETQKLEIGGAGTLAYLQRAVMWSHTYRAGGKDPFDRIWRLHEQGPNEGATSALGSMLYRVIFEGLASGTGTDGGPYDDDKPESAIPLVVPTFDYDEDSNGNPWPAWDGEFTSQVGESLLSVTQRLMQLGLYVEMDPDTFELNAWPSAGHRRSRTGAAFATNVVRFQAPIAEALATGNIKDDLERVTRPYVKRTAVLAGGGEDIYGLSTGPADIPWHGAWTIDPNTQAAAEAAAEAQLGARSDAADNLTLRIRLGDTPASGAYRPWDDVKLDDEVTVHTGTGKWEHDEATYPVAAIRVQLMKGGTWDAWVELGSTFSSFLEQGFQVGAAPSGMQRPLYLCTATTPGGEVVTAYETLKTWEAGNEYWTNAYGGDGTTVIVDRNGAILGTQPNQSGAAVGNFVNRVAGDGPRLIATPGDVWRVTGKSAPYGSSYPCTNHDYHNWSWGVIFYTAANVELSRFTVGTYTDQAPSVGWLSATADMTVPASAAYARISHRIDTSLSCQQGNTGIDDLSIGIVTTSSPTSGTDVFTGTSSRVARCDHTHPASGVTDHGALTGLADDDHPQYATNTELTAHEAAADPHTGYVKESDAAWVDLTDGGASTAHSHAGGGGGGGGGWTQGINESGASFANFTAAGGTWASNGTEITQTDAGGAFRRAKHNTKQPIGAGLVYEADLQIVSGGGGNEIAGLVVGFDGSNGNGLAVRLDVAADELKVELDSVTALRTFPQALNAGQWYTVRIVTAGHWISVYLNGVLQGSTLQGTAGTQSADFVGLVSYGASVKFRNIKAWTVTLP